jgi:spore germination protein GerM
MSTPPTDDSDLRSLFDDAVSDVYPEGGTSEIRARAGRPSAGRWVPLTVAAAVATVVVIVGAAWLAQRQPGDTPAAKPGNPAQEPTSQASSDTSSNQGRTVQAPVYYVGRTAAGPRLFAETHRVTDVTQSQLQVAVQEVLSGPPLDPDLESSFRGVTATAVASAGKVTIELSEPVSRPPGMNEEQAQMAVQSLVWTADAAAPGSGPVTFTVDGAPAAEVLGIDTSAPVERASGDSVLSTVSIATPGEGAVVPTRFEVTGQAATFEANVVWELKMGDKVVRNGFTTARECCTLSPYSFFVTATPGDYTLVVHDTDESDGEGIGTSEDTKRIKVQ